MAKRGQAVIMDLFVAISVFIVLLTILIITWDLHTIRLTSRVEYDELILRTLSISDTLVKSEGFPFDWENSPSSTLQIGLAQSDGVLSTDKVTVFAINQQPSEDSVRRLLKTSSYKYYFAVRDFDGTVYASRGTAPTGKVAVDVGRIVIYQGAPRVMEFALWKD